MNLKTAFEKGKQGFAKGLPTGLLALDKTMRGIQQKMIYGIAGGPKSGKCLALGTKVVMYDMTCKKVEDVVPGDLLLGLNGESNKVTSVTTGQENMYWVHQSEAMSYRVNESHILSLKNTKDEIRHMSVLEFLKQPNKVQKRESYGYKSLAILPIQQIKLDPYYLGLWLGDGHSANCRITTTDQEIEKFLYSIPETLATKIGLTINFKAHKKGVGNNYLLNGLRYYKLLLNKHIPTEYLYNDEDIRLKVLAGLIDTDGCLTSNRSYEILQKNSKLSKDIVFLANSLGFNTTLREKIAAMKRVDGSLYTCKVSRITIKGDVSKIPIKISRKKTSGSLRTTNSVLKVEFDKLDNYYGFCLENEDKRFYLEDFTVTHNTTFADFSFLLSPFDYMLEQGRLDEVIWIYYSFEIDRISKEFKFACYYFWKLYNIVGFMHGNKWISMSPDYLMGKLIDDAGNTVTVLPEHEAMLINIYKTRLIYIFGEYDDQGVKITQGKVDFITHKENPTGLRKHLFRVAEEIGEIQHETYNVEEDQGGKMVWVTREKMNGYIPKDPKKFVIVITDHLRKIPKERGFAMKENVDKYLEYQVEMRDLFRFTFVDIIHTNRNMASVDRMKHSGEFLYPTGDDLKDTGNLSEDCNILFTVFNANDQKYNLVKHFGVELKDYPNYRSIHIVESRDTDCPAHFQCNMLGGSNVFSSII